MTYSFACLVALLDLRRLHDVVAAALGLLREGAIALEPLDADLQQHLVFVHQRRGEARIGLAPFERHPVEAVLGEQVEPFLEAVLIDQPGLADDEIDQLLVGRRIHDRARHIAMVMNFDQARNWLRICHSVVPLVTAVVSGISAGS